MVSTHSLSVIVRACRVRFGRQDYSGIIESTRRTIAAGHHEYEVANRIARRTHAKIRHERFSRFDLLLSTFNYRLLYIYIMRVAFRRVFSQFFSNVFRNHFSTEHYVSRTESNLQKRAISTLSCPLFQSPFDVVPNLFANSPFLTWISVV